MFTGFCLIPVQSTHLVLSHYFFDEAVSVQRKKINPNSDETVDINFSNRYYLSRTVSKN